ncbi:MAG: exopolyphosphatase, partial [Rhodospirillaceae bacterium]
GQDPIFAGNRFMIYALFPASTVSIHVLNGLRHQNTVLAIGKSIVNRASKADIGSMMLKYSGGGHLAAGTCQVDNDGADKILTTIIEKLNAAG